MTKSVPASNLKGLFSDTSSSAPSPSFSPNPSPPPTPISSLPSVLNQHSGETAQPASPAPGHSFLERAKAGAADLAAKAKAAAQLASKQAEKTAQAAPTAAQSFAANMKATGQLVVKQAERTKIVQVTLTTAYFALGKSLYAAGNLRGEFPDAFKDVDDLLNATKAVDAQAAGRTTGDGLTAKAKAAGQAAMDMAQKKKLQVQSNYALSTLGKLALRAHLDLLEKKQLIIWLSPPGRGRLLTHGLLPAKELQDVQTKLGITAGFLQAMLQPTSAGAAGASLPAVARSTPAENPEALAGLADRLEHIESTLESICERLTTLEKNR